jgi:hypothetical protein
MSRALLVGCAMLALAQGASADTIYLKDGRKVEAKISTRDSESVTVDWFGVGVKYWFNEIDRIEEGETDGPPNLTAPSVAETAEDAAPPEAEPEGDDALIRDVLERSGLKAYILQIPEQIDAQMAQRRDELPPAVMAKMREALVASADTGRLVETAAQTFREAGEPEKLRQVLQWLQRPEVQRITELELASSEAASSGAIVEFLNSDEATKTPPERVALIDRLEEATNATDAMMESVLAIVDAMAEWAEAAQNRPGHREELQREGREQLGRQRDMFEQAVMVRMLFTYRALTDDELRAYVEFWESELGRWFSRTGNDALIQAVRIAGGGFAGALGSVIPPQGAAPAAAVSPDAAP